MNVFEIEMTQLVLDEYLGNEGYRILAATCFEVVQR